MKYSYIRMCGYWIGGLWTAWGGRNRIEAKQVKNLRRLVQKARESLPIFMSFMLICLIQILLH